MRYVIYARYSSDQQSERSIDDQIRLCRERVDQLDAAVVETYTDYAISGANALNRPGLQAMLEDARTGRFDAVMAEALDRLSRDQEDVAGIYKRLSHRDIRIVTLAEGEVNELHVGLKGTMNALFLKDLAAKTKRGQRGRVEAGRAAGGITYGYDMVRELDADGNLVRGKRRINPEQAAVVRRIFEEYTSGLSPRSIAAGLNREGIPSPRGGKWNASTINGNKARRNGVLHNELYIGYLIYNRQTFRKDPDTGKRVARPNPREEWAVAEVPELRIIDDDLWEGTRAIKNALARRPTHHRRRPKRLLSGLVFCGVCGGGYTVLGLDRFGCSTYREKGTCTNKRTIAVHKLENRVLEGLKKHLLAPEAVAEFVREYHAEMKRQKATEADRRKNLERELAEVTRKIAGMIAAIEDGMYHPSMKEKMTALEDRKAEINAELAGIEAPIVLEMHPNLPDLYARKVERLQEALNSDTDTRHEAVTILRSLIDKIVLHAGEKRGELHIELHGELAAILRFGHREQTGDQGPPVVRTVVVAGAGFEPATFRL